MKKGAAGSRAFRHRSSPTGATVQAMPKAAL